MGVALFRLRQVPLGVGVVPRSGREVPLGMGEVPRSGRAATLGMGEVPRSGRVAPIRKASQTYWFTAFTASNRDRRLIAVLVLNERNDPDLTRRHLVRVAGVHDVGGECGLVGLLRDAFDGCRLGVIARQPAREERLNPRPDAARPSRLLRSFGRRIIELDRDCGRTDLLPLPDILDLHADELVLHVPRLRIRGRNEIKLLGVLFRRARKRIGDNCVERLDRID